MTTPSRTFRIGFAIVAVAATATAVAQAHGGHAGAHALKPTPEEIAAFEVAKPVFEQHCFRCHTADGKKSKRKALDHLSMDHYPFGGHHADDVGSAVRKVLGAGGNAKATMPSDDRGAVRGDDLAKIVAWADAFDRAHDAKREGASPAGGSAHTRVVVYTCPMHPEVISSKPGQCPKCGMTLVPKEPADPAKDKDRPAK